jgi:DNA-binding GntR family transcriptional regulator
MQAGAIPMPHLAFRRDEAPARGLYDEVRLRVISAQIRPREALSESRVAAEFGVSRTPVREVFQRLADEGLLRIVPQVGTFVAPISLAAIHDSQFIRETLECRAVALAARNATEPALAALRGQLHGQSLLIAKGDRLGFFAADEALHRSIMEMAGHPTAWELIASAKVQLDRLRHLSLESREWLRMIFSQHRDIVSLITGRNRRGAESAMRAHLRTVFAAIERIAQDHHEFFEGPALPVGRRPCRSRRK